MKKNKKKSFETFEYSEDQINTAIAEVGKLSINSSLKSLIINCLKLCLSINSLLNKNRSLRRLIGRLFGFKSEGGSDRKEGGGSGNSNNSQDNGDQKNKGGHGRRGYKDFEDAEKIFHEHPNLNKGDPCPEEGCDGKVYPIKNPGVYVRITAEEPVKTIVHLCEKLRCNLCGKIFEFVPDSVKNSEKYGSSFLAHLIISKCYLGASNNRVSTLGPVKPSTQSELFGEADNLLRGVYDIILKTTVNDYILAFDDTKLKIQPEQKGGPVLAWGSAFVSNNAVVYIINRDHAGICLESLLKDRCRYLSELILLSDALPAYRSYKQNDGLIDTDCLVHARRRFMDAAEENEQYCKTIKDLIGKIYKINDDCRSMSIQKRMDFHREQSGPIFNELMDIMQTSLDESQFLPNSEIFKAINYWVENFNKLTCITRVPGTMLDTNHVERAIKALIRIRKQAPIYKTINGARRSGRMLSIVETCRMNNVPVFKYLDWAIENARKGVSADKITPWVFKILLEKGELPPS